MACSHVGPLPTGHNGIWVLKETSGRTSTIWPRSHLAPVLSGYCTGHVGKDYNSKIYRPPIVMKVVINHLKDISINLDSLNATYLCFFCI